MEQQRLERFERVIAYDALEEDGFYQPDMATFVFDPKDPLLIIVRVDIGDEGGCETAYYLAPGLFVRAAQPNAPTGGVCDDETVILLEQHTTMTSAGVEDVEDVYLVEWDDDLYTYRFSRQAVDAFLADLTEHYTRAIEAYCSTIDEEFREVVREVLEPGN
ncbi:MAG TPA: hypothetical protein VLI05_06880 [Candidatus Saccharimonadia bacterium]|nr:hypothetical protein [Candidatus Saccharimonadia bacterium]